jgi:hypothetical protein
MSRRAERLLDIPVPIKLLTQPLGQLSVPHFSMNHLA